jgi:S-adenosyl methyltransferase
MPLPTVIAATVRTPTLEIENQMSSASVTPRSRDQVARFFTALDMVPPGLVPIDKWGLAGPIGEGIGGLVGYCGIGRKP